MSSAAKKLKLVMFDRDMQYKELAAMVGKPAQTLYNQFCRDVMSYKTFEEFADLLGCDIVLRDRKTGKLYE